VFISEGRNVSMSECGDAMSDCSNRPMRILTSPLGVLQCLPGMLVSRQVILFSNTMGMRRSVMYFSGLLVVLVM
jgi:hypothetical protein